MKTKFYLLIPVLSLAIGFAQAQVSFPTAAVNNINSYSSFDMAGYGNNTDDQEGLVKAVFCYEGNISLNAVQTDGGEQYASYAWYLLDKAGNEPENAVQIANGNEGQQLNYAHQRSGYHRFRVYGYNKENQEGCFEITEIAIYVMPQIEIEAYQATIVELCQNEYDALQNYADGAIVLDATLLTINDREVFNDDRFEKTYEWFITNGGTESVLQSGLSASYTIGTGPDDLSFAAGNLSTGTFQYGLRVYYSFEEEAICNSSEVMMYTLTITPAPSKPTIRIEGAAKTRS